MGKALIIIVLGFTTVLGGIMFNITGNHQRASRSLERYYDRLMARYTAQSITNVAISRILRDSTTTFSSTLNGVSFVTNITDITSDSTVDAERKRLTIITGSGVLADTLITDLIKPAYSHYYYFVDNWPGFVTWGATDTIRGPVHANDQIQVVNNPVFLYKMTTNDNDETNYSNVEFREGVELGTTISLPPVSDLQNIDNIASLPLTFNNELWLRFNGAGGAFSCSTSLGVNNYNLSNYNVISTSSGSGDDIHVRGQYNGNVTVVSDNDLFIENNLSRVNNSTDYLGLMAVDDIIIDYSAGMNTITAVAALLALDSIGLLDPMSVAAGFTLQGSFVADTDNLNITRNLIYDERLLLKTSPYFSRTDRFEVIYRSF